MQYFVIFQQRLTEEAEMTEGFKTLLKDLHELMNNIKDSGITLRRESNLPTVKNTTTTKDVVPDEIEHGEITKATKGSSNTATRSAVSDISTTTALSDDTHDPSSHRSENRRTQFKRKSSTGVHVPLHSSSPKNSSPVLDNDTCYEYATELDYPYSDISDVESDFTTEDKQERAVEIRKEPLKSSKPRYDI